MQDISIIIPVYNVEQYLPECIESILKQTKKEIEIILVDDGSTDRSGTICEEYASKDTRIRVIHKKNGGLSEARNYGIDIAQGEYIGFVDSDDYIHPQMYELLFKAIKEYNVLLSSCSFCRKITPDFLSEKEYDSLKKNSISKDMALANPNIFFVNAWNKLYHRSLFQNFRYPVGQYHEDEYFHRIIYQCERIVTLDVILYYYRIVSNSIMTTSDVAKNSKKIYDALTALDDRINFALEKQWHSVLPAALKYYCDYAIRQYEILKKNKRENNLLLVYIQENVKKEINKCKDIKIQYKYELFLKNYTLFIFLKKTKIFSHELFCRIRNLWIMIKR